VVVETEHPGSGQPTYQSGVCNIGPREVARRRRSGLIGIGMAIAIGVALVVFDAPPWLRVFVFLPLAGGLVGLEQARRHFCAGFGMAGVRNLGATDEVDQVVGLAERAADRRTALILFAYCAVIAAVVTGLFVVAPV
jgi:hypothetical protein